MQVLICKNDNVDLLLMVQPVLIYFFILTVGENFDYVLQLSNPFAAESILLEDVSLPKYFGKGLIYFQS